eukprot:g2295.t1
MKRTLEAEGVEMKDRWRWVLGLEKNVLNDAAVETAAAALVRACRFGANPHPVPDGRGGGGEAGANPILEPELVEEAVRFVETARCVGLQEIKRGFEAFMENQKRKYAPEAQKMRKAAEAAREVDRLLRIKAKCPEWADSKKPLPQWCWEEVFLDVDLYSSQRPGSDVLGAFRRISLLVHPDKNPNQVTEATLAFKAAS